MSFLCAFSRNKKPKNTGSTLQQCHFMRVKKNKLLTTINASVSFSAPWTVLLSALHVCVAALTLVFEES